MLRVWKQCYRRRRGIVCAEFTRTGEGTVKVGVNLPRHPSRFWLPRVQARFYPNFIARLTDGRVFVVEYKGEHLVTAQEAREKDIIGRRWAEKTGNVFLTVRRMQHGAVPAEQMQHAIDAQDLS